MYLPCLHSTKRGGIIINDLQQARIVRANYTNYTAEYHNQIMTLEISGRMKYQAISKADYPVVGDYVLFHETNANEGIIERILERQNTIERLATSTEFDRQVLASNIDLVFICMSLNEDFHLKKLRNFIILAEQQDLDYHIVLTKSDLSDDIPAKIDAVRTITENPIDIISVYEPQTIETLQRIIGSKTCVLLGSSGVGKSSIINAMMQKEVLDVNDIRMSDAQGRHTTTHRELFHTPTGGSIIDTPGIRVIQFYHSDALENQFTDIQELAEECRFRNCKHDQEPGCNVQNAIDQGDLEFERLEQYNKLLKLQQFHERQATIKQQQFEKRQSRR